MRMRKRVLSLLVAVSMTLSLLPGAAFAVVGDLLDNRPAENQALLEELEELTGQDAEAIQALLEQYGLLDENGNLVTDKTVTLDGVEYTLEEMEALLSDPATDLSRVAEVDGVPIALGDLKTIIAIERELARIQETYFSGKTFEGEARDNLNRLMAQLQSEGITLNTGTAGDTAVVDVSGFTTVALDYSTSVSTTLNMKAGVTYSVDLWLESGLSGQMTVRVFFGNDNYETLSGNNDTATLTYTPDEDKSVELKVYILNPGTPENYAYGELDAAVQFRNARGFVFQNGAEYSDSHTVRMTKTVAVPDLSTRWEQDFCRRSPDENGVDMHFEFLKDADRSSNKALGIVYDRSDANRSTVNAFINTLQRAKGYTSASQVPDSDVVCFSVSGSLQAVTYVARDVKLWTWDHVPEKPGVDEPNMFFLPEGADRVDLQNQYYGMGASSHFIAYNNTGVQLPFVFTGSTKMGAEAVPSMLEARRCLFDDDEVTANANAGVVYNCVVELTNDENAPVLKSITAPSATYRPGQLVPVVLAFNELVYVKDGASITINGDGTSGGKTFTADELHMSKAGNQIILWYPVQKVDGSKVTINSLTGITDIFGNEAEIDGKTARWTTLESALYRDAATGVDAGYDAASGKATVTVTLSSDSAYKNKYNNYHQPTGDEAKELPFRAVVTNSDRDVVATEQVYLSGDGETFATKPFAITPQTTEQTYSVTLQVNEGTRDEENWKDLSYRADLSAGFTVAAMIPADRVAVTPEADAENYTLSLAETTSPVLTAKVYGPDGQTLATHQSGSWSSSDEEIATVTTDPDDYSGQVALTGNKIGPVTFTFTADNGTLDNKEDDPSATSETYTVIAGDSLALVIPDGASTIVARQNAAATVLWRSNAAQQEGMGEFSFTVELFEGNFTSEAELAGKEPVATYTAGKDKNSVRIEEQVLNELSSGSRPAYTVRVSMPHPNVQDPNVKLSALAWIVVQPEPAVARLTRPENISVQDSDGALSIGWAAENLTEGSGQTVTLTVTRVTGDNQSTTDTQTLSGASGTYVLPLQPVADGELKDTYQIVLSVDNPGEAPSSDSFPLYVYNGDALKIVDSQDRPISSLTLDNTDKVSGNLPTETAKILELRQELGLLDYIGINYGDYSWNSFLDGIAWATDNDDISVNYKQGGLYENIRNFDFDTYLPELKMGIASVKDGEATITATHAATGMTAAVSVTANTLRDKFYLFQMTPAVETTLRYQDGKGVEKTVTTNSDGVLALYEPDGIASDVWLSSETGDAEYMGTLYHQNLQSGERDATKLQLYPLNTFRLREAAKAELTLVKPDGSPLAGTDLIVRGGVFKNDSFCETAGLGTSRGNVGQAGADQADTTFATDQNGKITVYFDATQFWSQAAGETIGTVVSPVDQIRYALEIRNIAGDTYYPVFQVVSGSVSAQQEMRTASGVVVLEEVPANEKNKPFVARQVVDYHLKDGTLIDTRHSTGFVGPNYNFKEAVLTTTMLLWGQSGGDYTVAVTDENGYVPAAQTSRSDRYPFASMPVVENTLTLNEETMTTSGWLPDGKDVGLKTRLTLDDVLLQERTMPFRAIDLTRVTPVNEDENVTGVLVTMQNASGWADTSVNFGNGGSNIFNALLGDLGELAGPVDTKIGRAHV